jgi:hypothetical protein
MNVLKESLLGNCISAIQLKQMLELFKYLIQICISLKDSDWSSPLFAFICLGQLTKNQLISLSEFSASISKGKFMLRSFSLVLFQESMQSEEEFLQFVNDYPESSPTVMSRLISFSGAVRVALSKEMKAVDEEKVHVLRDDPSLGVELMIEGARFHFNEFLVAVQRMMRTLEEEINGLLYGCDTAHTLSLLDRIGSETILENSVGFDFVVNVLGVGLPRLLVHFSKIHSIREWKELERYQFLSRSSMILKQLLVLMHITGGAPPRSTEILYLQFTNSQSLARSFYIHQGCISLLYVYNKTQNYPPILA